MTSKAQASFALGMSFMKKLCAETKENFVFSPLSLGTAFAMLTAGLKGDTKKEVLALLGCTDEAALHAMYSELIKNTELPLKIANKYLADDEFKVKQDFDKLLREKYESEVELVNFAKDASKVEGEVNAWVASKTSDMIKHLLSSGTLTGDTVFVLLNAVYFKGTWMNEFEPLPYEMDFKLRDGTKVKKNFMTKKSSDFKYLETELLKMVKIPYKEAGCYMVVAVPADENKHIDEVLGKMTAAEMSRIVTKLENLRGPKVVLTMPKFKIDYRYGNVVPHLKSLGVNKIFKAGVGDFGDLFDEKQSRIAVSGVVHQAVIEVDETGTVAAAATAILMMKCSMGSFEEIVDFDVSQPFYFAIHTANGLPTFQGVCVDPKH